MSSEHKELFQLLALALTLLSNVFNFQLLFSIVILMNVVPLFNATILQKEEAFGGFAAATSGCFFYNNWPDGKWPRVRLYRFQDLPPCSFYPRQLNS